MGSSLKQIMLSNLIGLLEVGHCFSLTYRGPYSMNLYFLILSPKGKGLCIP